MEHATPSSHEALRIMPHELHARLTRGEQVLVIDVRTADALRLHPSQIPGARWLPLAAVVEQTATLPRQGTIVTY